MTLNAALSWKAKITDREQKEIEKFGNLMEHDAR